MYRLSVIAGLLVVMLSGCPSDGGIASIAGSRVSDEQQIAMIMDDVQLGIQRRQIYKVLAHVARGYRDEAGRDYEAVRDRAGELMKAYHKVDLTRALPKILVKGDQARVVETFGLRGEPAESDKYLPVNMQGNAVVFLYKLNGIWLITSVTLQ